MEKDRRFDSAYTKKVRAGNRRTYFFDVRQTRGDDYYLTITESTKKFHGDGFERHKIFLYKEDFNRFQQGLHEAIEYVKSELMPDYDYEEFDRRQDEWEEKLASGEPRENNRDRSSNRGEDQPEYFAPRRNTENQTEDRAPRRRVEDTNDREIEDDDMSW